MIEYIKGELSELTPTYAVIDCGGVGYLLNISVPTYSALDGAKSAKLLVHEAIREDAHVLYGFVNEQERSLFRLLIGVSGVGANTARMILSSIAAPQLEQIIMTGDHSVLKKVKGIGSKTAERIIVDLKDKIKPSDSTLLQQQVSKSEDFDEALAAMVMLGFPRQAAHKVLTKLYNANPTLKVEDAIKKALTMM
jgi:Holliday junction DNA helicase RuvA